MNQVEKDIKKLDEELAANDDVVAAKPGFFDKYQAKKDDLTQLMEDWEAIQEEIDSIES